MYIHEQETSVCMCYTVAIKQKTQSLFDEFSYSFNFSHVLYIVIYTEIYMYYI